MKRDQVRSKYTLEFKREAVRQVKNGQTLLAVSQLLNVSKSSLSNWVLQDSRGELDPVSEGAAVPAVVTPQQMELARLRAENARLRMERDIAKKAAAYFAQDTLQSTPGLKK